MNIKKELENLKFNILVIFFDWGDTIMRLFPDETGPMANWRKLQLVDGVREVLPGLKNRFILALLSNADDSDEKLAREALEKVNIAKFFQHIFTPHELIARKPAPQFFRKAMDSLNVLPEHAVMVGDDYEKDIIAAKQVGMWTIWFNPAKKKIETEYPYHDFEVQSLTEIPAILEKNFK